MVHLPILRAGKPYRSMTRVTLDHVVTGEPVAEVSQANRGLIARDLAGAAAHREVLRQRSTRELLDICKRAADLFMKADLPMDDGVTQSPDDYVKQLSGTTGMPYTFCRSNMDKIHFVMDQMERVVDGLTRGLDVEVLDRGYGDEDGRTVSYLGESDTLGAVLPSNSPGVHSLWIPSVALKVPLVLKPGSREPWTPLRVFRALQAAGCSSEALSLYPADHSGATEILMTCGRSMLFGDVSTLEDWKAGGKVQLHGPGWSKVLIGDDAIDGWEEHLDVLTTSIAANGGRSCINASGVWVTARGDEVAEVLATRLAEIPARPLDHPEAGLAAFSDPEVAHKISAFIDQLLDIPGAEDVSARVRGGGRIAEVGGCTFLLPTIIRCQDPSHPLAASEFLFPFASVVEAPRDQIAARIGPTLVGSALTGDSDWARELLTCGHIDRLNLGAIPTVKVSWDQPHEGNLFDHLYRRRSFQSVLPQVMPAAAGRETG